MLGDFFMRLLCKRKGQSGRVKVDSGIVEYYNKVYNALWLYKPPTSVLEDLIWTLFHILSFWR